MNKFEIWLMASITVDTSIVSASGHGGYSFKAGKMTL
jgi:hypothetical protein